MTFCEIIRRAGLSRRTVKLKLRAKRGKITESVELEPYSRKEKGDEVAFFCLDVETCSYLDVKLSSIIEAEMTGRNFKPRFPVTF